MNLVRSILLTISGLFCSVALPAMKTPENSSLFSRWTDCESGVVSYRLKDNLLAPNQQSVYFVNKSMSEDGRFLILWTANDERETDQTDWSYAVIHFEKDSIFPLNLPRKEIYSLDPKTDRLYYLNDDGVFIRDLKADILEEVKICDIPQALKEEGKLEDYITHLTLNHDRTKIFIDAHVARTDRWIQGVLDIPSCTWTKWMETDFRLNHGQMHPRRDDIALCAHETRWLDSKGQMRSIQNVDGVYPRLQLVENGRRTIVPPLDGYATHECWDEQGDGFYWCSGSGVTYCELESRKQYHVAPYGDHAMMSIDRQYVVSDIRIGPFYRGTHWRVQLWSRERDRQVFLCSTMNGIASPERQSNLHPDPHPQFVCGDRYIVWTLMGDDCLMHLMVTPFENAVKVLDRNPLGKLPENCQPRPVAERICSRAIDDSTLRSGNPALCVNALQTMNKTGNVELQETLSILAFPLIKEENRSSIDGNPYLGSTLLEIYMERCGTKYDYDGWLRMKDVGLSCDGAPDGSGRSLFLESLLLVQSFRVTHDHSYLERAAEAVADFEYDGSPSEDAAWAVSALSLVIRYLDREMDGFKALKTSYSKRMRWLLRNTRRGRLTDSCSRALAVCAFADGINNGYLRARKYSRAGFDLWQDLNNSELPSDSDALAALMMACNSLL